MENVKHICHFLNIFKILLKPSSLKIYLKNEEHFIKHVRCYIQGSFNFLLSFPLL